MRRGDGEATREPFSTIAKQRQKDLDGRVKRSRMTPYVLLVAWLVSLGAVYVLGLFSAFAFHRAPGQAGMEGLSAADRAYLVLVGRRLDQPVEWPELKSSETRDALPEQVQALLRELDREPEAAHRQIAAETIAEVYPSRKVVPAIQQLLTHPRTQGRDSLLSALFERWGEIDGRSALDFGLNALPDDDLQARMIESAIAGLSATRPEMAWDWVQQNPAASWHRQAALLATALGGQVPLDPERVVRQLEELGDPALAEEVAAREAVRQLSTEGVRAAFAFGEAVTADYEGRTAVLSRVLESWARNDLATALRWFEGLEPGTRSWALLPIIESWSARDGAAALQWLEQAPGSPARTEAIRAAALNWLQDAGPASLGEFLNSAADLAVYSPAIEMLALETMSLDPQTALSWARLIDDPARQRFVTATVANHWLAEEPQAAQAALSESEMAIAPPAAPPETPVSGGSPTPAGTSAEAEDQPSDAAEPEDEPAL